MRTETIKLYKFEELSKEAKEKAIEEYRELLDESGEDWWEPCFESFNERLKEIGIECKNFYFDIFRDRHFKMDNADIVDRDLLLEQAGCMKYLLPYSLDIDEKAVFFQIFIDADEKYGNKIYVEADYDREYFEDEEEDEIERTSEEMSGVLQEFVDNLLGEFLRELEKEYEYRGSDEVISENLINSEVEFTKNGERY